MRRKFLFFMSSVSALQVFVERSFAVGWLACGWSKFDESYLKCD